MKIRKADKARYYEQIWDIFSQVIKTGDTDVFDPGTPKETLDKHWLADYMDTYIMFKQFVSRLIYYRLQTRLHFQKPALPKQAIRTFA